MIRAITELLNKGDTTYMRKDIFMTVATVERYIKNHLRPIHLLDLYEHFGLFSPTGKPIVDPTVFVTRLREQGYNFECTSDFSPYGYTLK